MKIMWIANLPFGALSEKLGTKISSGQWLNAEIEKEKKSKTNELVVYTSGNSECETVDENIKYVMLSHGAVADYSISEQRIIEWQQILKRENPDVILIWGTEYRIGLCVLRANNHRIPAIVYIQGVMSAIAERYRGSLSDVDIKRIRTPFEIVFNKGIKSNITYYEKIANEEHDIISLVDGIVVENDWAASQYSKMNKDICIYRSRLPIRQEFQKYSWNDCNNNHTIITTAASNPLKGLHVLLKALISVKKKYKDVKLIVPGFSNIFVSGFINHIKQSGYSKELQKIIDINGLRENIDFVGPLTAEQYGKKMAESCLFVSASAIENHCSTLREAMIVGVPSIASNVGGIPEYAKDHLNCTLFDYRNDEELANAIIELFSRPDLRKIYSEAGKKTIYDMYITNPMMELDDIYIKAIKSFVVK